MILECDECSGGTIACVDQSVLDACLLCARWIISRESIIHHNLQAVSHKAAPSFLQPLADLDRWGSGV